MDASLVWSAVGTLGTCAGLGMAWLQLRVQMVDNRQAPVPGAPTVFGASVAPPTGRLPVETRGRDQVLRQLGRWMRRPPSVTIVLVGLGGIGKSTVAVALAERAARGGRAGRRNRRVWWISAEDQLSLAAGLVTVARQLDATPIDLQAMASGAPDAPDRFWSLLEQAPPGWLLIFDNADDPEVLARDASARRLRRRRSVAGAVSAVSDGTGWIRPSPRGLTMVTSRNSDPQTWGRHARVCRIGPVDEDAGAQVLLDLAPRAGGEAEARLLAQRLGSLPLALYLAGTYLDSAVAQWRTFAAYQQVLDSGGGSRLLDDPQAETRAVVTRTWEISLDDLARCGVPHARPLLRLLSCWAPVTSIPLDLLDADLIECLLRPHASGRIVERDGDGAEQLEEALRGLNRLGLIEAQTSGPQTEIVIHPVVADTNRIHLSSAVARPGAPDADLVRRVAVDLITSALSGLNPYAPTDWERFRLLGTHLRTLLDTVAPHLGREPLAVLISAVCTTSCAIDQSGAIDVGESLCLAALDRASGLGADHLVVLQLRHQLAWETASMGRLDQAEGMYRQVFVARRRLLGEDHPDTLVTRHELAWIAAAQKRWEEAEGGYQRVLPALRRALGEEHTATLFTRHEHGWALANQGRLEDAETELRPILSTRRQVLGEEHPHTLATFHELAWIMARRGRSAEAEVMYRRLLVTRLGVLGDEHHHTLSAHHELAWVLALQGRWSQATTEYEKVLRARRQALGEDHPDTLATLSALQQLANGQVSDARHIA
ncbi:tetratricopeptide repeat protein [Streptomyces phaeochromogenes]|uniref:tetratricopeptide repeat protein n=1 Tax=Streptomyces phaeochromogenes TaxID=1923 RepID=UPI0036C82B0A